MDFIHFHCENCNSAIPEMSNVKPVPNITCVEELINIINSNLVTWVKYDLNCKNCAEIKNKLINIGNYVINNNYHFYLRIYNIKLIEKCGFFMKNFHTYCRMKKINSWTNISEKEFFDSIKVGSLLETLGAMRSTIDKIRGKFYEVNLVQTIGYTHYYLIESPIMTKPARKNNLGN